MGGDYIELSRKGRLVRVPATSIGERTVVVTGGLLKIASVFDEDWTETGAPEDPTAFIRELKQRKIKADIFTFSQHLPDVSAQKYSYPVEWDNLAVIRIDTYDSWLAGIEYDARKAVKKSAKLGVTVRPVQFDDDFVRGIQDIYNESPVRQGKHFWHYGKDFETVKRENSTYLERSEFIGAYFENRLIGYIRMVYVGKVASTLQVIGMNRHFDKKPVNALIAKAVEVCAQKGKEFLVYDKYDFGSKAKSSFTEFKRRNGFQEVLFPRYFVPLNVKGALGIKLNLQHGLKHLVPARWKDALRPASARFAAPLKSYFQRRLKSAPAPQT